MSFMEKITERKIAGFFAGVGALFLIYQKEYSLAGVILASLVAFFVGENNGFRKASQ